MLPRMHAAAKLSVASLALFVTACVPPEPSAPPEAIVQGMADALVDTGFYSEAAVTRRIGEHYNPSDNTWKIIACFDFALPDGAQGTACVDSFSAFQLENGIWVATATINGVYRWRAIGALPAAMERPAPAALPDMLPPGRQPADIPAPEERPSGPEPSPDDATEQPADPSQ